MKCEMCDHPAVATVVVEWGDEVEPFHLCAECIAYAGVAAAVMGAVIRGVYELGKEPGSAARPSPCFA